MRRGLIARSRSELPDAVLDARAARLRAALTDAGLDALIAYTNNTQPAAVSWLTGFVPYWSEALVVAPRAGDPFLVAALTFRVKSWIERTSRVADVIHSPRIGLEAARMIGATKADAAVGVVDLAKLPTGIADDLAEAGPRLRLSDASDLFARLRARVDPAELALTSQAATIACRALAEAPSHRKDLAAAIAAVEAQARRLGAEETYIAAAPDLARDARLRRIEAEVQSGERFALRATVAYKGCWTRVGRTYSRDGEEIDLVRPAERLAHAITQLPGGSGFEGLPLWLVEGCRATQPLAPLMGSHISPAAPPGAGMLVSVQARFLIDERPIYIAAPALIGARGEPSGLLVDPSR